MESRRLSPTYFKLMCVCTAFLPITGLICLLGFIPWLLYSRYISRGNTPILVLVLTVFASFGMLGVMLAIRRINRPFIPQNEFERVMLASPTFTTMLLAISAGLSAWTWGLLPAATIVGLTIILWAGYFVYGSTYRHFILKHGPFSDHQRNRHAESSSIPLLIVFGSLAIIACGFIGMLTTGAASIAAFAMIVLLPFVMYLAMILGSTHAGQALGPYYSGNRGQDQIVQAATQAK